MNQKYPELMRAIEVIKMLRHPEKGCPWDKEQTHETLVKFLLEETYEFIHEIETNNNQGMCEELGDVLMQLILHTTIGEEEGTFNLEDVAKSIADKLIFRHPHVFNPESLSAEEIPKTGEEVLKFWPKLKAMEKKMKGLKEDHSLIPQRTLMASPMTAAFNIGKKSNKAKFDWDNVGQVGYKVEEEWQELKEVLSPSGQFNREAVEEELGDLFFSLVQLSRHLDFDPEVVLKKANQKFLKRFHIMEEIVAKENQQFLNMTLEQKEHYWNQAKERLKSEISQHQIKR